MSAGAGVTSFEVLHDWYAAVAGFRTEAQNARAARSKSASMFRMPATVFTRIGKKADKKTMNTFDHIPIPNQMMISGTMAIRGVA